MDISTPSTARTAPKLRRPGIAAGFVALASLAFSGPASAGGYDTGERDWDFLFQTQEVAVEAATRYIHPDRTLTNIVGTFGPSIDASEAAEFAIQRYGMAINLQDSLRCLASYRVPWAGYADYGTSWTYAASAVTQDFYSEDLGLTCALSAQAGPGRLSIVGGFSHQTIHYELTQFFARPGLWATTDVSDSGYGWRAGLAYEIPEYALRATAIYNSAIDYRMTGTVVNPLGYVGPVVGDITMPQSFEVKLQSGVAPGWLAFGSVKWTDWSVADNMPLCSPLVPNCNMGNAASALTLLFQDTWTVTLGAAHQFNEALSVAGSLTWDQGATQGFTSQTDTWTAGLTAVVLPGPNMELKFGGTIGVMTGGTLSTRILPGGIPNPVGYTASFGDDLVFSLSTSAVLRF